MNRLRVAFLGLVEVNDPLFCRSVVEIVENHRAVGRHHDLLFGRNQGIQDKLTCFEQILKQESLSASEAAFVGDDVIDLPVMRNCGLGIAVANARAEVKKEAQYVTSHSGGDGALRDAIEYILKAQGKWRRVVSDYICERSPQKSSGNSF